MTLAQPYQNPAAAALEKCSAWPRVRTHTCLEKRDWSILNYGTITFMAFWPIIIRCSDFSILIPWFRETRWNFREEFRASVCVSVTLRAEGPGGALLSAASASETPEGRRLLFGLRALYQSLYRISSICTDSATYIRKVRRYADIYVSMFKSI